MALEAIMRQTMMLFDYAIETIEELAKIKKESEHKLTPPQKERAKLYKIVAKTYDLEKAAEAQVRLKNIKPELKAIRTVIHDCEAIEKRASSLEKRIKDIASRRIERNVR